MNELMSAHQEFFLNSWHFLFFAAATVLLVRLLRGFGRRAVLLGSGFYFLFFMVKGTGSFLFLAGFALFSYLLGEFRLRFQKIPLVVYLALIAAYWLLLFLVKDPNLLAPINPFFRWPVAIVGISFIVFRCLQYVMDVDVFEERGFLAYLSFVFFFPTLMAGPLERFENYLEFYAGRNVIQDEGVMPGLHRVINGCLKKFVLADNLYVFCVYALPDVANQPPLNLLLGILSPLLILYLDFSGYCDIMIGLCRLMGFELSENFDRFWLAKNVQEFWDRWHMTLSRFVRDYVFTPISRAIYMRTTPSVHYPLIVLNYFFCMMLIALWHGTTWGFFVFGLLHGAALVAVLLLKRLVYPRTTFLDSWRESAPAVYLSRAATYCYISLTMVFWYMGPAKACKILLLVF